MSPSCYVGSVPQRGPTRACRAFFFNHFGPPPTAANACPFAPPHASRVAPPFFRAGAQGARGGGARRPRGVPAGGARGPPAGAGLDAEARAPGDFWSGGVAFLPCGTTGNRQGLRLSARPGLDADGRAPGARPLPFGGAGRFFRLPYRASCLPAGAVTDCRNWPGTRCPRSRCEAAPFFRRGACFIARWQLSACRAACRAVSRPMLQVAAAAAGFGGDFPAPPLLGLGTHPEKLSSPTRRQPEALFPLLPPPEYPMDLPARPLLGAPLAL